MNSQEIQKYNEGQGCECNAWCEGECGCGVDWTPKEVYVLRNKITELELSIKDLIEEFAEASCMGDLAKIARNYGYEESKDE
jgi:hypothetical protein